MSVQGPPRKRSVALSYDKEKDPAPRIAAQGEGLLSDVILRLAQEYGIPVQHDPVLAEALSRFPEGDPIPPELYRAVAEVYAFLIRTRRIVTGEKNAASPPGSGQNLPEI